MISAAPAPAPLPLEQLMDATTSLRHALVEHPVYARLSQLPALQSFMRAHVFAVWDFMSLLKTLQRRLTCVDVPWMPPADIVCARWINEIVLGEETDEVRPGEYRSHFDLYLEAMGEAGADALPMRRMLDALRAGVPVTTALEHAPSAARDFVRHTLALTQASTHEVAAAFLLGREHLLPSVFEHMLQAVTPLGGATTSLRLYLERHILLDGGEHGSHAASLLTRLCGEDPRKWREAEAAALSALRARQALWDGVLQD